MQHVFKRDTIGTGAAARRLLYSPQHERITTPWEERMRKCEKLPFDGLILPFQIKDRYEKRTRKTHLSITGWDRYGRTVQCEMEDKYPYFYVRVFQTEKDLDEPFVIEFENLINDDLKIARPVGVPEEESLAHIVQHEIVLGTPIFDRFESPSVRSLDESYTYIKFYVAHPKFVRKIRTLFNAKYKLSSSIYSKCLLCDTQLNYAMKTSADYQIGAGTWYQLPTAELSKLDHYSPAEKAISQYAFLYKGVPYSYFVCCPEDAQIAPPPLRRMAFDIEVRSPLQRICFSPAGDQVNLICCWLYDNSIGGQPPMTFSFNLCDTSQDLKKGESFHDHAVSKIPEENDVGIYFSNERDLLNSFNKFILITDPDVIAAHNGNGYDWRYLLARAKELNLLIFKKLSRARPYSPWRSDLTQWCTVSYSEKGQRKETHCCAVEGRLILDTMLLAKKLNAKEPAGLRAQALLYGGAKHKIDLEPEKICKLQRTAEGRFLLWLYCLRDAEMVMILLEIKQSINFAISLSHNSGLTLQDALNRGSCNRVECNYLHVAVRKSLARGGGRQLVVPDRQFNRLRPGLTRRYHFARETEKLKGGQVLVPVPGFIDGYVITLDFKSLYPSIINFYRICQSRLIHRKIAQKLGLRENAHYVVPPGYALEDLPNAPCFLITDEKDLAPLQAMIQEKLKLRKHYKDQMTAANKRLLNEELSELEREKLEMLKKLKDAQQLGVKLSCNDVYGVCSLVGNNKETGEYELKSSIAHEIIAAVITRAGRYHLCDIVDYVEKFYPQYRVVYGDTDSIMVHLRGAPSRVEAYKIGKALEKELNQHEQTFDPAHSPARPPLIIEFEGLAPRYLQNNTKKLYIETLIDIGAVVDDDVEAVKPKLKLSGLLTGKSADFTKEAGTGVAECLMDVNLPPVECVINMLIIITFTIERLQRHKFTMTDLLEKQQLSQPLSGYKQQNNASTIASKMQSAERAKRKREGLPDPANDDIDQGTFVYWVRRSRGTKEKKVSDLVESPEVVYRNNYSLAWKEYATNFASEMVKIFGPAVDQILFPHRTATPPLYLKKFIADLIGKFPDDSQGHWGAMLKFLETAKCESCASRGKVDHKTHKELRSELTRDLKKLKEKNDALKKEDCFKTCCGDDIEDVEECATWGCHTLGIRRKRDMKGVEIKRRLSEMCKPVLRRRC